MAKKQKQKQMQEPEVTGTTEAEYDMPKAVEESIERPADPIQELNETINREYPWCVPSLTSPQRAILCELVRIRKALEAK